MSTTAPALRPSVPVSEVEAGKASNSQPRTATGTLNYELAKNPSNHFIDQHAAEMRKTRLLHAATTLFAERGFAVADAIRTALTLESELEARL